MSRKRKKSEPKRAVPDEILAEGSGPHEVAVDADAVAEDGSVAVSPVAEADAEVISVAVDDATEHPVAELEGAAEDGEAVSADAGDGEALVEAEVEVEVEGELVATVPTTASQMDDKELKHLVEALVFASDKPVTLLRLRQLTRVADVTRLERALAELATDFADRGLILQQVSGGYQFRTQTRYSGWVQQLIAGRPVRLSRAQLETLAIVAYRQPITRPEIDDIRGVDSSGTIKVLLDRALVRVLGKREEVGRPMLYGTTKEFLDFFSLGDLRELPTLREYSELTPESRRVMTDELGPGEAEADAIVETLAEAETAEPVSAPPPLLDDAVADVADLEQIEAHDELASPEVLAEAAAVASVLSGRDLERDWVDDAVAAPAESVDDLEAASLDHDPELLADDDAFDDRAD